MDQPSQGPHWCFAQGAGVKFQHTTDEMFAYAGLLPLQDSIHANRLRFFCPSPAPMPTNHMAVDQCAHHAGLMARFMPPVLRLVFAAL